MTQTCHRDQESKTFNGIHLSPPPHPTRSLSRSRLSVSLCLSVSLSLCLSVSISLSVCLSFCLSVCLCLCLCPCLCPCLCLCPCFFLQCSTPQRLADSLASTYVCPSVQGCLSLSVSPGQSQSVSFFVSVSYNCVTENSQTGWRPLGPLLRLVLQVPKAYPCRPYFRFLGHSKVVLALRRPRSLQISATARQHNTAISDEPPWTNRIEI
jgi:hypothetical protein